MTSRQWNALFRASLTHPRLVRATMGKMAADLDKPCPPLVDMFTRADADGEGFIVEIVYPAKPRRIKAGGR